MFWFYALNLVQKSCKKKTIIEFELKQKYKEDGAESIKAGIGSLLIYRGADLTTTQEFAQAIGKKVISQRENFTNVVTLDSLF